MLEWSMQRLNLLIIVVRRMVVLLDEAGAVERRFVLESSVVGLQHSLLQFLLSIMKIMIPNLAESTWKREKIKITAGQAEAGGSPVQSQTALHCGNSPIPFFTVYNAILSGTEGTHQVAATLLLSLRLPKHFPPCC